ncbi:hypothetical protein HELRODRAFT_190567 [Helobdella robusta]|uniref:Major facilitator superfamily (MFS) profile domain-containing protein n=1 Tax=Helobdella robusta TaxID=6412 RepID=T1FS35_HELRO|nr:hypothetical protein HELRODRAFT_190567 [Helobdella robusta]ESO09594.1 hypothetical protein HELRODRAFT_190567 [Helobdella robusta]
MTWKRYAEYMFVLQPLVIFEKKNKVLIGKCIKTTSLYLTFWMMGLTSSLIGTSFVHLEKLFGVTSNEISIILVIFSVGYLVGAILCAFIYDRGVPEFYFVAFNLLSSFSTLVSGAMENIFVFGAAIAVQGCGMGFDDAAGQSYCVNLWLNHRLQRPFLQAAHALWSLGGVLSPIVIKIFLCEFQHDQIVESLEIQRKTVECNKFNSSTLSTVDDINCNNSQFHNSNVTEVCAGDELEYSRYAFYTIGSIIFAANIPFLIISIEKCLTRNSTGMTIAIDYNRNITIDDITVNEAEIKKSLKHSEVDTSNIKFSGNFELLNRTSKIIYLCLLFIMAMLNMYIEILPINFLVSFAVKHLKWSVMDSSLLLSCFFTAHFVGRILAVLTSACIRPIKMISANIVLTAIGCTSLLLSNTSPLIVWAAVTVAGLGVSNTFPSTVLWVSETVPVSGRISSIMIAGASVGTISSPYFVSLLTVNYGTFSFIYVLISAALAHVVVFIFLYLFITKIARRL